MLREDIRQLVDRNSLSQVLDSLSGAIFDLSDESTRATEQKTLEGIGRIVSKQSSKAYRLEK